MIVKLLTEHHLEFLSLKGGCTGSSESTLVKMSNCWKSRALAQIIMMIVLLLILCLIQVSVQPQTCEYIQHSAWAVFTCISGGFFVLNFNFTIIRDRI